MVGCLGAVSAEGQQPQPRRVRRGEQGGDQAGEEDDPARRGGGPLRVAGDDVFGGSEDGLLGEEAAERRDRGQREERHGHRPVGVGDAVTQVAHAGHDGQRVGADGVDDHAGGEEQQRLEGAVGQEVEDGGSAFADGEGTGHVAELADRRVGEDAFDVVLGERGERRAGHGDGGHDGEDRHRGLGGREEREETGHEVDTGGDHRRSVDQRGDGGRARHRVGEPGVQRELRRLARHARQEEQGDRGGCSMPPFATASRTCVIRKEPVSPARANRPMRKGTSPSLVTRKALREAARASGVSQ